MTATRPSDEGKEERAQWWKKAPDETPEAIKDQQLDGPVASPKDSDSRNLLDVEDLPYKYPSSG